MITIQQCTKDDLKSCAKILKDIYNNNVLNEGWTDESSLSICEFYFNLQPDLFFVAKQGGAKEVVGFTYCFVKPWANGNSLMIEEISVKNEFRQQNIGKKLLKHLVETAKQKYDVKTVNGATYLGENGMPFSWYKRIGFKKVEDLFLIEAETDDLISKI